MSLAFRPGPLVALACVTIASLVARGPFPVDETRYLAVAWEMWHRGEFVVPLFNGNAYGHKPPLLFWLMHAGWAVFGVATWWPRLVGPIAAAAALVLIERLARAAWPDRPGVARTAPWLLLGSWCVLVFATAIMFDMVLLAAILGAHVALFGAVSTRASWRHWAAWAACVAIGLMTKGPVVLVYVLPAMLLAPRWACDGGSLRWRPWLARAGLATALAALPLVAWLAIVAADAGGGFVRSLVVEQVVHRVSGAMGHGRPLWWYLPWLVAVALPWIAWPRAWRAWRAWRRVRAGDGERFVRVAGVTAFVLLSLIGGKQVHYLIPVVAIGVLALARALDAAEDASRTRADGAASATDGVRRTRVAALVSIGVFLVGSTVALSRIVPRYDLTPAATYAGAQAQRARPLAYLGHYQGEFTFAGRLREPVRRLHADDVPAWLAAHPDGLLIARRKRLVFGGAPRPEYVQPYKSDTLLMLGADELRRLDARYVD